MNRRDLLVWLLVLLPTASHGQEAERSLEKRFDLRYSGGQSLKGEEHSVLLQVHDPWQGGPVAGASVEAMLENDRQETLALDRGSTDVSGKVRFRLPVPARAERPRLRFRVQKDERVETWLLRLWEDRSRLMAYVSTDRAIYRAGETVHLRALAFHGGLPAPGQSLRLEVVDGNQGLVSRHQLETSASGVASARFTLPEDVPSGPLYFDVESDERYTRVRTGDVEVTSESEPRFRLEAKPLTRVAVGNEPWTVQVAAESFLGEPIAGAIIELRFDGATRLSTEANDEGRAELVVEPMSPIQEWGREPDQYRDVELTVRAEHPVSGRVEQRSLTLRRSPFTLHVHAYSARTALGGHRALWVVTSDAEGNPAAADFEVSAGEWKYEDKPEGRWAWQETRPLLRDKTNRLGVARVDVKGPAEALRVVARSGPSEEEAVLGTTYSWVGRDQPSARRLELRGRALWRPEEPIELTLTWAGGESRSPLGPVDLELWRYDEDSPELLEDRSVELADEPVRIRFDAGRFGSLDTASLGRLYVVAREPAQQGWQERSAGKKYGRSASRVAVIPLAPRTTMSTAPPGPSLSIESMSHELRPGDTATLQLRFSGADGTGLAAVAGLTAVRAASREHQVARQGADSAPAFLAPFQQDAPRRAATVGDLSLLELLEKPELDEAERLTARFLLDQASSLQARALRVQHHFDPVRWTEQRTRQRFREAWHGSRKPQWPARKLVELSSSPEKLVEALAKLSSTGNPDAFRDPWGTPYSFRADLSGRWCTITARSNGLDRAATTFDDVHAGSFGWPCFDNTLNALSSILSSAYDAGHPRPEGRSELLQLITELSTSTPEIAAIVNFTPGLAELLDPWGKPWAVDWAEGSTFELRLVGGPERQPITLTRRVVGKQRILEQVAQALREAVGREPLVATRQGLDSLWLRTLTELGRRDLWDKKSGQYFLDWQRDENGRATALSVLTEGVDGVRDTEDDATVLEVACLPGIQLDATSDHKPAEVTVVVADSDGSLLPGVTVEVCSLYDRKIAVTDANGRATVHGLSPALLRVTAQLEGFEPAETILSARPRALLSHHFTLYPSAMETITVTSEAPLLDERRLQQGTAVTSVQNSVHLGTPPLRRDFRKTLAFLPEIDLENGTATVELPLSDDVSNWHISSVAHDAHGRLATAELELESDLPVYVEPDVPRRFTVGDKAQLPFLLHNRTEDDRTAEWRFEAEDAVRLGRTPRPHDLATGSTVRSLEARFREPGPAALRATASTRARSESPLGDAVEVPFIIEPHAYRETAAVSRLLRLAPSSEAKLSLELPADRLAGLGSVAIDRVERPLQLLEQAALDLERRPTGCTEQTVSTARLSLALLELGAPGGLSPKQAQRSRQHVGDAVQRILRRQHPNGSFGYWAHESGSLDLTVYVIDFLQRTEDWTGSSGDEIQRAVRWIESRLGAREPRHLGRVRARTLERLATIDRRLGRAGDDSLLQRAARLDERTRSAALEQPRSPELTIDLASRLLAGVLTEEQADAATQRLVARSQKTTGGRFWTSSTPSVFYSSGRAGNVVATALALRALHAQGADETLLTEGLAWLLQRQSSGGSWSNTEATVEAIEAALEIWGAQAPGESAPPTLALNGEDLAAVDVRTTSSVEKSPELRVHGGEGWTLVRLSATYYRPWKAVTSLAQHDEVSLDVDCPERRARRHTPVTCRISGTRSFGRGMLTARIGLPPGATVDQDHLRAQWEDSAALSYWENGEDEVTVYLQPQDGRFDFELRYEPHLLFDGVTKPSSLEQYYRSESRVVLPPRRVSVVASDASR